MNYIGLYGLLIILGFSYPFKSDSKYTKYVIIGAFIPSLDLFISFCASLLPAINIKDSLDILSNTFSHSIFTLIILLYMFFIASIIIKKNHTKGPAKAVFIGALIHIILDIFFSITALNPFWPIIDPMLKVSFFKHFNVFFANKDYYQLYVLHIYSFEFLFLFFYGKALTEIMLKNRNEASLINKIGFWSKAQLNLFLFFLSLSFVTYKTNICNTEVFFMFFCIFTGISIISAIKIIYKSNFNII